MLLQELLKRVEAQSIGTEGETLFVGVAPAEATTASIFVPQGGDRRDYAPELRRSNFQVISRAPLYADGASLSELIADALVLRQSALGPYFVYECGPKHEPLYLGSEESGVPTFVVNYTATWREA